METKALEAVAADFAARVVDDPEAAAAWERLAADVGILAKRVGEVWPEFVGPLQLALIKAQQGAAQ